MEKLNTVGVQLPPLNVDAWNDAFRSAIRQCPETAMLDPQDFSSHAARRGISTALAEIGVSDLAVQSVLGHKPKGATGHYVQPRGAKKQRLLDTVGAPVVPFIPITHANQASAVGAIQQGTSLRAPFGHFGAATASLSAASSAYNRPSAARGARQKGAL
jgi:hypothetical protein